MSIIIGEGSLNVTYKRRKACGNKLFLVNWIYIPALAESIFHLIGFTGTQNDSILCLGKTKKLFLFNNEKEDLLETDHLEFGFCNLFPLIWSFTLSTSQKCQSLYLKSSDRKKKKKKSFCLNNPLPLKTPSLVFVMMWMTSLGNEWASERTSPYTECKLENWAPEREQMPSGASVLKIRFYCFYSQMVLFFG